MKHLFKVGTKLFICFSLLSHLLSFFHHDEEKKKEEKEHHLFSIVALVGIVAALGYFFKDKLEKEDHRHLL